jgi:hypothetical protein
MNGSQPLRRRKLQEFGSELKFQFNARSAGKKRLFPSTHRKVVRFIAAHAFSLDARPKASPHKRSDE